MTEATQKSRFPRTGTLVLTAMVLLVGGGPLMVWLPYHRNQTAIAEVERLGGRARTENFCPYWIGDAVDDEYLAVFERVCSVDLSDTPASDTTLAHLGGLTELRALDLHNTQVSNAGLEQLGGMTNLMGLYLDNTQVTQAGIDKLQKALPHCKFYWTPPAE